MTDNQLDIPKLQEAFKDKDGKPDLDLFLFYVTWVKNNLNATKAYKELHPEVTEHSASVMGSRLLGKVDKAMVMQAYGLDVQLYYQQLKDGVQAMKRDQFTGEVEPDHYARKPYHDKLGKQLGIETDQSQVNVQVVVPILGELKAE